MLKMKWVFIKIKIFKLKVRITILILMFFQTFQQNMLAAAAVKKTLKIFPKFPHTKRSNIEEHKQCSKSLQTF